MAIKRTKYDIVFSNYIRERDGWKCQRCSKQYNKYNSHDKMALHCSHFVGRSNWKTRLCPANAMALCYGCHRFVGSHPIEHRELWERKFSNKEQSQILKLKNDTSIKKRDVTTQETYDKLKQMLKEVSNGESTDASQDDSL